MMEQSKTEHRRRKVAVIHPYLWWGGSEACALWAVEALKDLHQVTLITGGGADLAAKNAYYGTNIRPEEINIIEVPFPRVFNAVHGFFAIRDFRLSRYCKRNSDRFDVMFSSYNPMDFGRRGIQYVLDPTFTSEWLKRIAGDPGGLKGTFYRDTLLRKTYLRFAHGLAGTTQEGILRNVTIADSDWAALATRETFGFLPDTVYPPVPWDYPPRDWSEKENGFVCLGRINYEKRLDEIIGTLERVRSLGHDVHLHVIGNVGDRRYMRSLEPLLERNRSWIVLEGGVSNARKMEILTAHKYGLHGRANEPFGIAVAEMVKAGCIVWVPEGGGQVEIVNHTVLTYDDKEQAVNKIETVLVNKSLQISLLKHLKSQSQLFSTERYQLEIQKVVRAILGEKSGRNDTPPSV
jgi:glycosyltransferase involved in cell wall biosynthesis